MTTPYPYSLFSNPTWHWPGQSNVVIYPLLCYTDPLPSLSRAPKPLHSNGRQSTMVALSICFEQFRGHVKDGFVAHCSEVMGVATIDYPSELRRGFKSRLKGYEPVINQKTALVARKCILRVHRPKWRSCVSSWTSHAFYSLKHYTKSN